MLNPRTWSKVEQRKWDATAIGKISDYQAGGSMFNPRPGRELNRRSGHVISMQLVRPLTGFNPGRSRGRGR